MTRPWRLAHAQHFEGLALIVLDQEMKASARLRTY